MASKTNFTNNRNKNYFRIRKVVGHKMKDGKVVPIEKAFYGSSKRDAEMRYREWLKDEETRAELKTPEASFGSLADFYARNVLSVSSKYAPGTIERYLSSYKVHVSKAPFMELPIKDLKAIDIQMFYNKLDCSQSTMKQINKFMSGLFRWLNMNGYCPYLLSGVELAKKEEEKPDKIIIWTDEELDLITSNLGNHRLRFLVLLDSLTGLRIGELLGLKYDDFSGDILNVKRQYQEGHFRPPKANSVRQVPVLPVLQDELIKHKEWHEKEMKRKRYSTEYVFTTETGSMLDYSNVRRSLQRYYKKINVEPKKIHAYRATFCTNLCKAGVPIQVASKILGHKSIEVTARYYTEVNFDAKKEALNMLPPLSI